MKYLLPLILSSLLLCGCGSLSPEATEPSLPTEPVAGETRAPEEYGGAVQTTALNLETVQGMLLLGEDILLLSGRDSTTLTLLDPHTLKQKASASLDCLLTAEDLVISEDGSLSFFRARDNTLVLLDGSLRQVRRIAAPGGVRGKAILWKDVLYYCTASEIRAWDLKTNIRRRIREMAFDSQILSAVLMDGGVLQCQITENGRIRSLFLSAADGRLLHDIPEICSLRTCASGFYGTFSSGGYPLYIFGRTSPQLLVPRDLSGSCWFLPDQEAAVTASENLLDLYDLTAGSRRCSLALEPGLTPMTVTSLSSDTVLILAREASSGTDVLITWDVRPGSPADVRDPAVYVHSYHSAESPDTAGLERCAELARSLGERYGLTILLWENAAGKAPPGCILIPEHLVPLLLRELEILEQRLEQYPREVLSQTAAHFSSLNLCLVRSGRGEGCGSFFLEDSDAYVVIPLGEDAGQALSHGLFHAMEVHIFAGSHSFDQWDRLNPVGFQYDYDYHANVLRESGVYLYQEQRVFVDTFSMSYPREDRARIFEYAMQNQQEALFLPAQMQQKLQTLCTAIREAYGLSNGEGPLPWEKYLQ